MNYSECIEQARKRIGNYCKACPECNGKACRNQMPGPGSKGIGDTAIRNFDKCTDYKKCGRSVMFFQSIQNRGSITIFISGIEGQVNNFVGCILRIIGVIFDKLSHSCITNWSFAVFLKAESPVPFSRRVYPGICRSYGSLIWSGG